MQHCTPVLGCARCLYIVSRSYSHFLLNPLPAGEVNVMISSEAIRRCATSDIEVVSLSNSRINNFIEQNRSADTNLSEMPICNAFSTFRWMQKLMDDLVPLEPKSWAGLSNPVLLTSSWSFPFRFSDWTAVVFPYLVLLTVPDCRPDILKREVPSMKPVFVKFSPASCCVLSLGLLCRRMFSSAINYLPCLFLSGEWCLYVDLFGARRRQLMV